MKNITTLRLRATRQTLAALALIILAGCASNTATPVSRSSYQIGSEQTAVLGVAFLTDEKGSVIHSEQWQGIAFGGMHHSYTKSDDYLLTELFYGGTNAGVATIVMRQVRGNDTSATSQTFELRLAEGDTFNVGSYKLRITNANAGSMRFAVIDN